MSEVSERRRKARQKTGRSHEPVWVTLNLPGSIAGVRAKLVDTSELGLGVETDCKLELNAVLVVEGHAGSNGFHDAMRARVVECKPLKNGLSKRPCFRRRRCQRGES